MKLQLFALIAKQRAFHQLRSVEQLGYITVLMQRYREKKKKKSEKEIVPKLVSLKISSIIFKFTKISLNVGMILVFMECSL